MNWNHYHSKPSTCKAVEWDNSDEVFQFLLTINPNIKRQYVDCLSIPTREGTMIAYIGNFIIEDIIKGIYPCDARVFNSRWIGTKKITKKRRSEIRPHKMKNMTQEVVELIAAFNLEKEDLHYTDAACNLRTIKALSNMSERDLVNHVDLSKSEVHRMMVISGANHLVMDAAKKFNIEKYVLLEWEEISMFDPIKKHLQSLIMEGTITKREQLHSQITTFRLANAMKAAEQKQAIKQQRRIERQQS